MKNYVIASHGTFAKGIYESIKIIVGEQANVTILNAYVESNDVEQDVKKLMESFDPEDEVIVCTDVFGGSVNNEFMKYMNKNNYYLVTGMNIPLLMQLFLCFDDDTESAIRNIVNAEDTRPKFCNDMFKDNDEDDEEF